MNGYGKELILDIHDCDVSKFNRTSLELFFEELCDLLDMERCDLHFWDDEGVPEEECQTEPHLKGTSAVQFIMTSNITIHTLDIMKRVYLNIFSCKDFNVWNAADYCVEFFGGNIVRQAAVERV